MHVKYCSNILKTAICLSQHTYIKVYLQSSRSISISNVSKSISIFDRHTKRLQRERAILEKDVQLYDYLKEEIGFRLADKVFDIKKRFNVAVDLGCSRGYVSKHLSQDSIDELILCDMSKVNLEMAASTVPAPIVVKKKIMDEENAEFEPNSLDLVMSNLNMHWVNDLPNLFKKIFSALKDNGVFLGSVFGGDTLYELRSSLQLAELERQGGISPHTSPFAEVQDIGSLLTSAGFSMLTIDTDEISVNYPSIFELMWDLKGMAESNASFNRPVHLNRDSLFAAAAIYSEFHGKSNPNTENNAVPATFQVINMIGWKASSSRSEQI
ncbi:hypothetical protein WA026_010052 [Henosepilachna vigintioctopunctata]|uniref:NADH dehydrogenase [ubiquinone] 1 alpha subcomplex assembly factor 5 n=1 Tax=Henosepilachna vigintioctopunctata TaxID=420089 RepID=A0AAW1UHI5_9CUCU